MPHWKVRRPDRRCAGRGILTRAHAATGSRSAGSSTSSARAAPTRYSDPATTTGSVAGLEREGERRSGIGGDDHARGRRAGSPGVRERRGGQRPRGVDRGAHDGRAVQREPGGDGGHDPGDVLVGHRRPHHDERRRRIRAATGEVRPQVRERLREGRRAVGVVGAVEQHLAPPAARPVDLDQLEPSGPAGAGVPRAAGVGRDARDAGGFEGVEDRVGDRDVGRLVPAAERDGRRAEPRERDALVIAVPAQDRGGLHGHQRHAEPGAPAADHRQRVAGRRRSPPGRRAR